jgi:hypothetical protein
MESRFSQDFSQVRVHTDGVARESVRAVHARAYTVGHHIVMGPDHQPHSREGRTLLAHELTHVLQQRHQPGERSGPLRLSDPADAAELEAERVAHEMEAPGRGHQEVQLHPSSGLQRACRAALGPPRPPCTPSTTEPPGAVFFFERSCDDLKSGELARLNSYVAGLAPGTKLKAHGFASTVGPRAFNDMLSCHRANKLAALLRAVPGAVPVTDILQHGPVPGPEEYRQSAVAEEVHPAAPPSPAGPPTPGPAPATQHCQPWQTTMLTNHLTNARTWVDDAETKIAATAAGTAPPAVAAVVSAALTTNFHTTSPADVKTIAANFGALKTALAGTFNYECAGGFWCSANELAYVRGRTAGVRRLFDINVCPIWFSCGNYFKRVSTLIHERAHQYPGATDNSYEWEPTYATISASAAINNAESYAVATRQIYHGGAYGPGLHC